VSELRLADATVAIVGLGLMGSSLGLALSGRCARRLGADIDAETAARSLELGAVDEIADAMAIVESADLVVLATPVGNIATTAASIAAAMHPDAVLTDLGSTKAVICGVLDELPVQTIGGHPMCGRELSGPDAATSNLFHGATWAVCSTVATADRARELLVELIECVGACPLEVDRDLHDRSVAVASHLPYVVAQALVMTLDDADETTAGAASQLAATGFSGASRLAGGSVGMWQDVLASNAVEVRAAISGMQQHLARLADLLDEPDALHERLRSGRSTLARLHRE
jgi:prephenate dehydrogenase